MNTTDLTANNAALLQAIIKEEIPCLQDKSYESLADIWLNEGGYFADFEMKCLGLTDADDFYAHLSSYEAKLSFTEDELRAQVKEDIKECKEYFKEFNLSSGLKPSDDIEFIYNKINESNLCNFAKSIGWFLYKDIVKMVA